MADAKSDGLWSNSLEWVLDAPREKVWALIGDFERADKWIPSIAAKSTLIEGTPQTPGCVRYVEPPQDPSLAAATFVKETLLEMDAENYRFTYRVDEMCCPILDQVVVGYTSSMQLLQQGENSTRLRWSYKALPAPGIHPSLHSLILQWLYEAAVADLKTQLKACL